jgi:Domain of unknown function (DUF4412)
MRTYLQLAGLALGTSLVAAAHLAAQGFEGVVTYKLTGDKGAPQELAMSIKGGQMRTDMSAGGHNMAMLMNGQGSMTMLMPEQKMYMTMDLKAMRDRMPAGQHQEQAPPKITDLGTKETIAGRTCENYQVQSEKSTIEFCNTTGLGNFMAPQSPMGHGAGGPLQDLDNEAYREFFKNGFFPLRVSNVEGGSKKVVMEATRVESRSLDASLFQVPAGFTEMKMPGRM